MLSVGIVGVSEGNGHPFSFSAIVNGYDAEGLDASGWEVIYDYVRHRHPSEFGFNDVRITHAWTQDDKLTERLCRACKIPKTVEVITDFIGAVDAVIIARDDHERHVEMALPLLEAGLSVFVDKPLSMDQEALHEFRPYLENGQLMSCSGLRFARELDVPRSELDQFGPIRLIRGAVLFSWEKYGIHILEAVSNVVSAQPVSITPLRAEHPAFSISMSDGSTFQIDALGKVPKTFQIDLWGEHRRGTYELEDNFTAFRRTLWHFIEMIRTGEPPIDPEETMRLMRTLIAGRRALNQNKTISISDVNI
jgi:predicted dehydrogenase